MVKGLITFYLKEVVCERSNDEKDITNLDGLYIKYRDGSNFFSYRL